MRFNIIDVHSGMVTLTPIVKHNQVLLDSGVKLTSELIRYLKQNDIKVVDVAVGNYVPNQEHKQIKTEYKTNIDSINVETKKPEIYIPRQSNITEKELTQIEESITDNKSKKDEQVEKVNQDEVTRLVDKVADIVDFDFTTISSGEKYKRFIADYTVKLDNFAGNVNSFLDNQDAIKPEIFITDIKDMISVNNYNNSDIINSILCMSDLDNSTYAHSLNVAMIAYVIGSWLHLDEKQQETLLLGGMLHDIGKIDLDQTILLKQGKLTDSEFEHIKQHPVIGWRKVRENQNLSEDVKMCILQHHEKLDGSGYPLGFKEPRINYYAKIITIADVYDAMTADRCYRKGMTPLKAASIIQADAYSKYDMTIAMTFLNKIIQTYIGETAILSNDHYVHIIKIDEKDLLHPLVQDLSTNQIIDLKQSDLEIKKLL